GVAGEVEDSLARGRGVEERGLEPIAAEHHPAEGAAPILVAVVVEGGAGGSVAEEDRAAPPAVPRLVQRQAQQRHRLGADAAIVGADRERARPGVEADELPAAVRARMEEEGVEGAREVLP